MKRRRFLERTGLSTALVMTGRWSRLLGSRITGNQRFPAGPRPEEWIKKKVSLMDSLKNGFRTNVYTGYIIPREETGFRLIERFPMNLRQAGRPWHAALGPDAFDHPITYTYAEMKTKTGQFRVDCLLNKTNQTVYMKQFLIELDGRAIGSAGCCRCGDSLRYINWFGGVRHGDYAFVVKDPPGIDPKSYRQTQLEIWEKPGAQSEVTAKTC